MKMISRTFAMAALLTTALGACSEKGADEAMAAEAQPEVSASGASARREPPLLEAKLDGIKTTDGKNVDSVMYIAVFPPGSVSAHHSHPGWEYNYILEGAVTFKVDGEEPYTLHAGEGMYNKRGNTHTVENASTTEPARLVSVLIKDEGAPVAVNVP